MSLINGTRFGRYEICSQPGAGGMGEVFLAHDTKLNRNVALKLLPVEYGDNKEHVRRFEREAAEDLLVDLKTVIE